MNEPKDDSEELEKTLLAWPFHYYAENRWRHFNSTLHVYQVACKRHSATQSISLYSVMLTPSAQLRTPLSTSLALMSKVLALNSSALLT
jgi:hypothetical protein